MDFIPEQLKELEVPYYDDVTAEGGWRGHATGTFFHLIAEDR